MAEVLEPPKESSASIGKTDAKFDSMCGERDGYSNEKWWGVGSKVQGYSGPGRVTQK